ncbi:MULTISPECIES: Crp/Fnr family transcriptional regulator [unclassified Treponema]|uniref:Crp/Fnr family transcriptional regulator n=1 Tax=unclassified Treponema TaxID=2638727 RepID=UPI0025EAF887|nr:MULTISPECIES: cyclic nucleotide-binding domain-containing protein [unclassified Treponema]
MIQLQFVNFKRGSYITVEGRPQNNIFYIIQCGNVRVHKENSIPGQKEEILGPGDFIGVISCMSNHSQVDTVLALTDVVCISVRREQYPELIEKNTPVAMKIIRTFANRMRLLNDTLVLATLNNSASQSPEQIYRVASYYDKMNKPSIAVFAYYQYVKANPAGINVLLAKTRFNALRAKSRAVYFESNQDLLRKYPKDTMIMAEQQSGADMFIIQSGRVKISKVVDGSEVTLAILKKGDMFGEMALLENKPRSACAIAEEDCTLMTVNRSNFNQMVQTQPQLIAKLTTTLAERLFQTQRQLLNSQIRDPISKMTDMLALQIEKARVAIDQKNKTSYQTDLTPLDIATMCGLSQDEKNIFVPKFSLSPVIKLSPENKIFVPDCLELIKQSAFIRKQHKER